MDSCVRVLLVTFPGQGHINPGLQFAKRLVKLGVDVTYAMTFSALNRMTKNVPTPPGLTFFGYSDGNDGGFVLDGLNRYMEDLKSHGSEAVANLITSEAERGQPFTHVVYTTLIPWAGQVAHDLHVPSTFLWFQPATVLDIFYYYSNGHYKKTPFKRRLVTRRLWGRRCMDSYQGIYIQTPSQSSLRLAPFLGYSYLSTI